MKTNKDKKMKMACIYSSKTGNTRMVAEAVHQVMPEGTLLTAVESAPDPDEFDFIALGFWVDKGTANARMLKYMERINNKKIGLFGTLGAYPDSEHAKNVIKDVTERLEGNDIVDSFMCQGKIDPNLLEAMKNIPGHTMTEERKARIEEAKKHPNEEDLDNVRAKFTKIIEKL